MSQARGDWMLKLSVNHETLIHMSSEQAQCARTVDIGQLYITKDSVVDGNSSTLVCREYSEPRNSQHSRLRTPFIAHVKIGLVTGIEVFESAGALVLEVEVPSRQQGHVKSWVRVSRGVEQHARHLIS